MSDPVETLKRFTACVNAGDLDGALSLYHPEAVFQPAPGQPLVRGLSQIREALTPLLALRPTIKGEVQKVLKTDDTALVINRWHLDGMDPEGEPVRMGGTSADVMRRDADGNWTILVDDPWGGEA